MNVLQQCYDEGIYPISFFNYMGLGDPIAGVPDSVKDWAELGITVGRSPNYDGSPDRVPEMRAILDACAERGMKLIVDDHRTTFHRYMEAGEAEYRKGVLQAVKDLEGHPALLGFDLGDEPNNMKIPPAFRCSQICHEAAPNLTHFLNMGPYSKGGIEWMGRRSCREYLNQYAAIANPSFFCHDVYWQMQSHLKHDLTEEQTTLQNDVYWQPPANDLDSYFNSLKMFSDASKRHNLPWWVTLLCCGHWEYRCPSEDDFRWQVSTAAACGAKGLVWYLMYMNGGYQNYRLPPIEHGQRTETYEHMSRVLRTFGNWQGKVLCRLTHQRAWHVGKRYGDWPNTLDSEYVRDVRAKFPVIVSEFVDADGQPYVMIVNNTVDRSGQAVITWHGKPELHHVAWGGGEDSPRKYFDDDNPTNPATMVGAWLAPGQMELYRVDQTSEAPGVAYQFITGKDG